MITQNVLRVYNQATREEVETGLRSYPFYRRTLEDLSCFYGYPLENVVATFCSLSPNSAFLTNLRSTATVCALRRLHVDACLINTGTYGHCRDRAVKYLEGVDFLSNTKGLKIRAFYSNILHPEIDGEITIDGHCYNIAYQHLREKPLTMKAVAMKLSRTHYQTLVNHFKEAAQESGIKGHEMQGICWSTWKRMHDIISPPQMELWRDYVPAEYIQPYLPAGVTPELRRQIVKRSIRVLTPRHIMEWAKENV